jgi:hypothetical protein
VKSVCLCVCVFVCVCVCVCIIPCVCVCELPPALGLFFGLCVTVVSQTWHKTSHSWAQSCTKVVKFSLWTRMRISCVYVRVKLSVCMCVSVCVCVCVCLCFTFVSSMCL